MGGVCVKTRRNTRVMDLSEVNILRIFYVGGGGGRFNFEFSTLNFKNLTH